MIDIPPLRIPPCLVPYCCFQWYAVATLLPILLYCTSLLQRRQAIAIFQTALRKNKERLRLMAFAETICFRLLSAESNITFDE